MDWLYNRVMLPYTFRFGNCTCVINRDGSDGFMFRATVFDDLTGQILEMFESSSFKWVFKLARRLEAQAAYFAQEAAKFEEYAE